MIRRITLENYMSHARTVIEPAAGLTVLAGPNNCGKSAVISALMSLRGDGEQAGDFMLRHGEKLCSVTVETDDGHTIIWRRKKASVSYVIDGVEIHRIGRGNLPDKLPETLRLPLIEPANSGKRFDLHFGLQKEPIFLIDSESDAARFFSASNDAERLLQMQQLQKERVKSARADERKARGELTRIDGKLAALSPLPEIDATLVQAERSHEQIVTDANRAAHLRRLIGDIERQNRERLELEKIVGGLSDLRAPPPLEPTAPLAEAIDKLVKAIQSLARRGIVANVLRPLRDAPLLQDEVTLRRCVMAYGDTRQAVARNARRVEAMKPLREMPAQQEVAPLAGLTQKMARWETLAKVAAHRQELLRTLPDPPLPLDPAPLRQWIMRGEELQRGVTQRRKLLAKTVAELAAMEQAVDEWIHGNPACPVCGGATDRQRLLAAGEHAHV